MKNTKKITFIDLFSGAGGLSLGLVKAGGIPIAAIDSDLDSTKTYKSMFPMCKNIHHGKIEEWQPNEKIQNVDVIIGGPPCQGFSLARGLRFLDDPRNHLYKYFVKLVEKYQPKWFVMENVPGITNIGDGVILEQIYEDFTFLGYSLSHKVVNMAEYGVPQIRKRAVFVGSKVVKEFKWPEITHENKKKNGQTKLNSVTLKPFVTIKEALDDLPWELGEYFAHRANSQMRGPRNRKVSEDPAFTLRVRGDEFAFCEAQATSAFIPGEVPTLELLSYRTVNNKYQQAMRENPPNWINNEITISLNEKPIEKLKGTRKLTVREQARLQSFPDWFQFIGSRYSQSKQIGNAVPPLFSEKLFKAILTQTPKK